MKTIEINTKEKNYSVCIGECLTELTNYLPNNKEVLIITDDIVKEYHFKDLLPLLRKVNYYVFSLGKNPEKNKTITTYQECLNFALKNYLTRNLIVIGFGGGAVGDFAAFFASTYKRGVGFINLPTTILAHDSSVGGKTGLNYLDVKNVVGTFYQPDVVLYHLPFLKTLGRRDLLSGFGEIIKHDLLGTGTLITNYIKNMDINNVILNNELMQEILYQGILVKKSYIEMDIYDRLGKRLFLNLGHTLGHALERLYHYSHGEAVSLGICFDLYLSNNKLSKELYEWFKIQGYFKEKLDYDIENIVEIIKNDKKNDPNLLKFIGLKEFGTPYEINLSIEQFITEFKEFNNKVIR